MNRREVNEEFFVLLNALCSSYPAFILSNITSIKVSLLHDYKLDFGIPDSHNVQ